MTDKYTPEMAHAAVERGAAWLDEHCPDWPNRINVERLELGSQSWCVLGQTAECLIGKPIWFRRYTQVLDHFEQSTAWAETHGFDVPVHKYRPGVYVETDCNTEVVARYEMLTIAWREYIRQRVGTRA